MKLHTIKTGLKQDQALAFKALAAEVLHVGYDFHILYDQVRIVISPPQPWLAAHEKVQQALSCISASLLLMRVL